MQLSIGSLLTVSALILAFSQTIQPIRLLRLYSRKLTPTFFYYVLILACFLVFISAFLSNQKLPTLDRLYQYSPNNWKTIALGLYQYLLLLLSNSLAYQICAGFLIVLTILIILRNSVTTHSVAGNAHIWAKNSENLLSKCSCITHTLRFLKNIFAVFIAKSERSGKYKAKGGEQIRNSFRKAKYTKNKANVFSDLIYEILSKNNENDVNQLADELR